MPLSRYWGLNAIILMLRTQDFSLLIAITEHRLRFNHRTLAISLSCRSKHDVNDGFFFIIYNTFSYPGGKNRKWRDELLNWKCLQFYQPKLIILQNTCNYWCDIFICIIKNIVFFFFKQPPHLCKLKHAVSHFNIYWWKKQREWVVFMYARPVEQCCKTHRQLYRVILT